MHCRWDWGILHKSCRDGRGKGGRWRGPTPFDLPSGGRCLVVQRLGGGGLRELCRRGWCPSRLAGRPAAHAFPCFFPPPQGARTPVGLLSPLIVCRCFTHMSIPFSTLQLSIFFVLFQLELDLIEYFLRREMLFNQTSLNRPASFNQPAAMQTQHCLRAGFLPKADHEHMPPPLLDSRGRDTHPLVDAHPGYSGGGASGQEHFAEGGFSHPICSGIYYPPLHVWFQLFQQNPADFFLCQFRNICACKLEIDFEFLKHCRCELARVLGKAN